jgi:putative ABC transport system permease protein
MYLVYAVFAFPSMYFIISQGWNLYYHYRKRNKRRYYDNILSDNEIEYSFAGNKKILFVLSLLSAMIIFFVASPISLFSLSERLAEGERLAHVEYVEFGSVNTLPEGRLEQLLAGSDTPLKKAVDHEFLIVNTRSGEEELLKPVISETLYKEINKDAEPVNEGEILVVITALFPGKKDFEGMDSIPFITGNETMEFKIAGTVKGKAINRIAFPSEVTLVLNDKDYGVARSTIREDQIGISHLFYFNSWRKTGSFVEALRGSFEKPSELYGVDTFLTAYREVKQIYAMMIFFTSFMGGLFLIAAGSILIFKQYGDLSHMRELYQRLTKLGMTKKEFMRMQASSQKLIFFTPMVFGTMIGFVFMYMTTFILGGGYMVGVFFRNAVLVVVLYFISQTIFYRFSLERLKRNVFQEGYYES